VEFNFFYLASGPMFSYVFTLFYNPFLPVSL